MSHRFKNKKNSSLKKNKIKAQTSIQSQITVTENGKVPINRPAKSSDIQIISKEDKGVRTS